MPHYVSVSQPDAGDDIWSDEGNPICFQFAYATTSSSPFAVVVTVVAAAAATLSSSIVVVATSNHSADDSEVDPALSQHRSAPDVRNEDFIDIVTINCRSIT